MPQKYSFQVLRNQYFLNIMPSIELKGWQHMLQRIFLLHTRQTMTAGAMKENVLKFVVKLIIFTYFLLIKTQIQMVVSLTVS